MSSFIEELGPARLPSPTPGILGVVAVVTSRPTATPFILTPCCWFFPPPSTSLVAQQIPHVPHLARRLSEPGMQRSRVGSDAAVEVAVVRRRSVESPVHEVLGALQMTEELVERGEQLLGLTTCWRAAVSMSLTPVVAASAPGLVAPGPRPRRFFLGRLLLSMYRPTR